MTDDLRAPDPDADLDALLRRTAPPALADDGFTARVMGSVRSLASAARTPSPGATPARAAWLSPAEAARRLARLQDHRRFMRTWTRRGALLGAAVMAAAVMAEWQAGGLAVVQGHAAPAWLAPWTGLPAWLLVGAVAAWWAGRVSQEG
jgi:hypothetical protein